MRRIPLRGATLAPGQLVALPREAAHYARDVLRLRDGDPVEIFDADGRAFFGFVRLRGEDVAVALEREVDREATESPCRITLYQGIPKKEPFEWLLEKATELGVDRLVPLETSRTVVRVPAAKAADRTERWQRISDEAARQCGRARAMSVDAPLPFRTATRGPAHAAEFALLPGADAALVAALDPHLRDVAIWIGPEGGFDDDEVTELRTRALPVRMGPRVLRAESAGIVAASVVQAATGGLG